MISITSPEALGKVLRRYRKEQGLTQSEAGKALNLSQKTVSQIEAGLPGVQLGTLFKLMSVLRLEMHLVSRERASPFTDKIHKGDRVYKFLTISCRIVRKYGSAHWRDLA
jgi:HTH-type transcriptional regulator/antitoxin HipB